jgi:hypothetical protein
MSDEERQSLVLRLLIHIIGDMHQPYHIMTRLNDHEFPASDDNGHLVKVDERDGISNLHDVLDSLVYEFPDEPSLPLSQADWDRLGQIADEWSTQYKSAYDSYTWNMVDYGYMAQEAYFRGIDKVL